MGFALLILTVTPTIAGFLHRLFGPENSAVRGPLAKDVNQQDWFRQTHPRSYVRLL
jgi:hypothetical protein